MNKKYIKIPGGLMIICLMLFFTLLSFFFTPYNPSEIHSEALSGNLLTGPSSQFWLGTDSLGRDILSRLLVAMRNSYIIAIISVIISFVLGIILGMLSGYYGKVIDEIIMRIIDSLIAIPSLLFVLIIITIFPQNFITLMCAIALTSFYSITRIIRSKVLEIKQQDYIIWAQTIGVSSWRIMTMHIFPEVIPVILTSFPIMFAGAILSEAGISYLGFTSPDVASFGNMLRDAQSVMLQFPLYSIIIGIVLSFSVIGLNMFADSLRKMKFLRRSA